MKYFLSIIFVLMTTIANAVELEFTDYNKLIVHLELYEGMPIAYVFDENNKALHFHKIERDGDYFLITKDSVNSWLEKGTAFKKDLMLEDILKITDNSETRESIKALKKVSAKYKILHFYPWFGALHQNQKLKELKEKRETLFSSISEEDNGIKVMEIDLSDRAQTMQRIN